MQAQVLLELFFFLQVFLFSFETVYSSLKNLVVLHIRRSTYWKWYSKTEVHMLLYHMYVFLQMSTPYNIINLKG